MSSGTPVSLRQITLGMRVRAWFFLLRPWSYVATLVPFLVGGALACMPNPDCAVYPSIRWCLGLLSGFFFQATVNLLNTWGDERSGVDAAPGAIRTTPQVHDGLVSLRAVLVVALCCAAAAVAIGVKLCFYEMPPCAYSQCETPPVCPEIGFCWTLLALGIIGALGSLNYSTGIKFKYCGLGVPFVSFLMGPLEVVVAFAITQPYMTERVMRIWFSAVEHDPFLVLFFGAIYVLLLGILLFPLAALVGVIMHGNDMRDIPSDRAAGIRTLATWLGPRRALGYYYFCHVGAYVPPVLLSVFMGKMSLHGLYFLLPFLALPLSITTLRHATSVYRAWCAQDEKGRLSAPPWRGLERGSGKVHLVFGVLYALAFYLFWG